MLRSCHAHSRDYEQRGCAAGANGIPCFCKQLEDRDKHHRASGEAQANGKQVQEGFHPNVRGHRHERLRQARHHGPEGRTQGRYTTWCERERGLGASARAHGCAIAR